MIINEPKESLLQWNTQTNIRNVLLIYNGVLLSNFSERLLQETFPPTLETLDNEEVLLSIIQIQIEIGLVT